MSGHDNYADQKEANILSNEAIRRSLLGGADPVELAKFGTLLMLDDEFERRVHRLELELADDFSFGQLSSEEQELFTSHFLVTPGRVRELAVSEALRKSISSKSATQNTTASKRWHPGFLSLFAFDRPIGSAALAGAALLIFGALFWLSLKAPPVRPPAISKKQQTTNTEKQYAHPPASLSPDDKSANDRSTAQLHSLTITLQPESNSESKPTLQLPKGEVVSMRLELRIAVDAATAATYRADLKSADGVQLASFSGLKVQPDGQPKVVIDVDGKLVQSGSYYVDLWQITEAGPSEVKRYSFEVKQD